MKIKKENIDFILIILMPISFLVFQCLLLYFTLLLDGHIHSYCILWIMFILECIYFKLLEIYSKKLDNRFCIIIENNEEDEIDFE